MMTTCQHDVVVEHAGRTLNTVEEVTPRHRGGNHDGGAAGRRGGASTRTVHRDGAGDVHRLRSSVRD
jgi:hypothetical protein